MLVDYIITDHKQKFEMEIEYHVVSCDNCNSPCKSESTLTNGPISELSIKDALSYLYGILWDDLLKTDFKNRIDTLKKTDFSIDFCHRCSLLLEENYTAHLKFQNSTHPQSLIQIAKESNFEVQKYIKCEEIQIDEHVISRNTDLDDDLDSFTCAGDNEETNSFISENLENVCVKDPPLGKNVDEQLCVESKRLVVKIEKLADDDIKLYLKKNYQPPSATVNRNRINKGPQPLFACNKCPAKYVHQRSLKFHSRRHDLPEHQEKSHVCTECGKRFGQPCLLKYHLLRIHRGVKPHSCPQCDKKFSTNTEMVKHIRCLHNKEKPFKCDLCEYTCSTGGNLKTHRRTHTGETPYECSVCNKKFRCVETMKSHTNLVHTGKRFLCEICGNGFLSKNILRTHSRIHKEASHECNVCKQKFVCRTSLVDHMRVHTGEKPFQCELCGTNFPRKGGLRVHMRTHTGERPHQCLCGKAFTQSANLKRHFQNHCPANEKLKNFENVKV